MKRLRPIFASLVLLTAGCFEQPVVEILLVDFLPAGGAVAALEVQIADPEQFRGIGIQRRMEDRERALLAGADSWLDRFDAVASVSDALEWRRQNRRLRSFSRSAEVVDPAELAALFTGDAAIWSFGSDGTGSVLELVPTRTSRASRRERDRTVRELAVWAVSYADYVAAARAVDARAAADPQIARDLWRAVFSADAEVSAALTEEELALAADLGDRMLGATRMLELDPREGFSLSERVREVYHPFAARLGVRTPCPAIEIEGFVEAEPGGYVVPELALGEAAERLEGVWLAVDPLRALIENARAGGESEVDLEPFVEAAITTEAPAPDGDAVAARLERLLRPPEVYRISWSCGEAFPPAPTETAP